MNTQELERINIIGRDLRDALHHIERLGGVGCVAASCCTSSEADGKQVAAERRSDSGESGASHVAPVQAKEFCLKWITRAAHLRDKGNERVYEACDCQPVYAAGGAADVLEQILPELETLLGVTPSRKAKADETIPHILCCDVQDGKIVTNQKRS